MEKRKYESMTMQVIQLQSLSQLLAASEGGDTPAPGQGISTNLGLSFNNGSGFANTAW